MQASNGRSRGGSLKTSTLFRRTEIEERILGAGFHVEAKRRLTRGLYMFRRTEIQERIHGVGFHVGPRGGSPETSTIYMFRRTEIEERILDAGFHVEAARRLTRNLYNLHV